MVDALDKEDSTVPNDISAPRVNFLSNIPLTPKLRAQIVHRFIDRASPGLSVTAKLALAKRIQEAWTDFSSLSVDEVYSALVKGPIPFAWPWLASDVAWIEDPIVLMAEDALAVPTVAGLQETQEERMERYRDAEEARLAGEPYEEEDLVETEDERIYREQREAERYEVLRLAQVEAAEARYKEEQAKKPKKHESFSLDITLNKEQMLAVDFARIGKSFVLTGAAGTGKTTAEREIVKVLLHAWQAKGSKSFHKFKNKRDGNRYWLPPIAVVSFTNKAANNSMKAIHRDPELAKALPYNITTIHNLLEFEPVFFERADGTTGMRFEPARNAGNPIDCTTVLIEEASNVGALDLYQYLYAALRPGTTLIFVGDINQLPPIFSPSILNYALVQLPVVELTEVYRQAMDSKIIYNAHKILRGEMVEQGAPYFVHFDGRTTKKLLSESQTVGQLVKALKKQIDTPDPSSDGEPMYDPSQDIILSPYNVGDAGTDNINSHVAQFLGLRRQAEVYEILGGMNRKLYLAKGDHVFFLKQEGQITEINRNPKYVGREPQPAGIDLTRWGMRVHTAVEAEDKNFEELMAEGGEIEVDNIAEVDEDRRQQAASHVVRIQYEDGSTTSLSTAGDFHHAKFSLGYALTVHKSQGSEWRKVYIVLHKTHATHLNREMIYTAVTRARTHCYILDFTYQLERGIKSQRVKGNSVKDKIAWFNSEISLKEPVMVEKQREVPWEEAPSNIRWANE